MPGVIHVICGHAAADRRRRGPLIGSVGDGYDNALAETTIGLYKTELINRRGSWKTLDQRELATLEWVDCYNHRRLHSACDGLPPVEYEQTRHRQNTQ